MTGAVILDTGPWVALHCRDDSHHDWAKHQFGQHAGPFLTCEAVVTETCLLLKRGGFDPAKALALIERGVVRTGMSLADELAPVMALFQRYDNVPASLADACLIRMSELFDPCKVLTLDGDFRIYRRHGRKAIPLIRPGGCDRPTPQTAVCHRLEIAFPLTGFRALVVTHVHIDHVAHPVPAGSRVHRAHRV